MFLNKEVIILSIGDVVKQIIKKVKRGLTSYIQELDFRAELEEILDGTAQKSDVSDFISKVRSLIANSQNFHYIQQMGLFLEILVPAFTQVHYYGAVVRPIVKKFNKKFKWAFTTQVKGSNIYQIHQNHCAQF